jgi:hypothetical protein
MDFADLHVLIDGEDGIADGGIRRRGSVAGGNGEFAAFATADFVGVALALGVGEAHGTGRREFVELDAVAVRSDIDALGLRDLVEIHSNAGEADGLSGSSAGISGRHFLDGVEIDATGHGSCNEDTDKGSHGKSVPRRAAARNCSNGQSCTRKQQAWFLAAGERLCGPSPLANPPFKQFMVTVAKYSLFNDLESQRQLELAEARAIRVGMLPQGPLRTGDATICYEFQPFL